MSSPSVVGILSPCGIKDVRLKMLIPSEVMQRVNVSSISLLWMIKRGSGMSAHLLLSLLKELRKGIKCEALLSILSLYHNKLNMLDSRLRGHRFELHQRHCVVSLSKTQ